MMVQTFFIIPSETQTFTFWYIRQTKGREYTVFVIYSKIIQGLKVITSIVSKFLKKLETAVCWTLQDAISTDQLF